jgi:hypothetical protein
MAKLRRGGGNVLDGTSMHNIVILAGMAVVLACIYYYIYMDNTISEVESFTDGKLDIAANDVALVLFYTDWCPHCVSFKPTWDTMTTALNGTKTKAGKTVKMLKVNCEVNKPLANKYGIDGYPTIKVITMVGGKEVVEDYTGQRDKAAVSRFLESL